MFVRRTTVIRSLLLFPPKHFSFLKQRVESGKHLKNNPDSSMLKTSSALYFCKICLSFSFHSSHVFSGTLPLSPQIFRKQISCLFLNLSNQPLLHLKSGRPREFAKTLALSWRSFPEMLILFCRHWFSHFNTQLSSSWKSTFLLRFLTLLDPLANIASLFPMNVDNVLGAIPNSRAMSFFSHRGRRLAKFFPFSQKSNYCTLPLSQTAVNVQLTV